MALAWNAGWVNSPRGFKSRILRRYPGQRANVVASRRQRSMSAGWGRCRRSMSRKFAVIWHAVNMTVAGVLYFFFVLPRWPELSGDIPDTGGYRLLVTVLRIVTGALLGLGALPVVFTWLRTRRPEFGTPQLALRLRLCSIVLHVLGGVMVVGTAISEIWLSLDDFGRWLFGIYGAAAAICLLAVFAFYLAFIAELPPPPPKPKKQKKDKKEGATQRRRRRRRRRDG